MRKYWYLAAMTSEFKRHSVLKRTLLNKSILIFRKQDGTFGAIENRCCHRNVELSLGTYENDCFTCGYHGWKFNSDGQCVHIPSLKSKIPQTAQIQAYTIVRQHELLWICLEPSSQAEIPKVFSELEHNPWIYTRHIFPGDLRFVSESLFDPYHIDHVHKRSIKTMMGNLNNETIDFNITIEGQVLKGNYLRENNSSVFEKAYFGKARYVPTYFEFHFPNISKLEMRFEERTLTIYEHMVEVQNGFIDMIQITTWKNIFPLFTPFAKWFMKRKSESIVLEDLAFFNSQKNLKNSDFSYRDLQIKSDKVSIEFRKFWDSQLTQE